MTYGKQGVVNRYDAIHHAIAYTSEQAPEPLDGERFNKHAIKIEPSAGQWLHDASRVNFSKVYTIEHNCKVKSIGMVSAQHQAWVNYYYEAVHGLRQEEQETE